MCQHSKIFGNQPSTHTLGCTYKHQEFTICTDMTLPELPVLSLHTFDLANYNNSILSSFNTVAKIIIKIV